MSPEDRLIAAWVRWEDTPGSRDAVAEKLAAIAALGLHSSRTHETIAAARRAGYDVPSACQAAVNELAPRQLKEAC